jgi:hypothetical protein
MGLMFPVLRSLQRKIRLIKLSRFVCDTPVISGLNLSLLSGSATVKGAVTIDYRYAGAAVFY